MLNLISNSNKQSYANANGKCECAPAKCVCSVSGTAEVRLTRSGSNPNVSISYTLGAHDISTVCHLPTVTFSFNTGAFVDVTLTDWNSTYTGVKDVPIPENSWPDLTVVAMSTCDTTSITVEKIW